MTEFTPKEIREIKAIVGAMKTQGEAFWKAWWLKFVSWAETEIDNDVTISQEELIIIDDKLCAAFDLLRTTRDNINQSVENIIDARSKLSRFIK